MMATKASTVPGSVTNVSMVTSRGKCVPFAASISLLELRSASKKFPRRRTRSLSPHLIGGLALLCKSMSASKHVKVVGMVRCCFEVD
jgi:hypothetical protein